MLSHDEKLEVLATARNVAAGRPVLMTVNEAATRDGEALARSRGKGGRRWPHGRAEPDIPHQSR